MPVRRDRAAAGGIHEWLAMTVMEDRLVTGMSRALQREGRYFYLATASLSVLGYHHDLDEPVIHLWNDAGIDVDAHVIPAPARRA